MTEEEAMLGMTKSDGKAPSSGVGELAGLLRELREMTPKELTRIEKTYSYFIIVC